MHIVQNQVYNIYSGEQSVELQSIMGEVNQCQMLKQQMLQSSSSEFQCIVCCNSYPHQSFYSISGNCPHQFCKQCCIDHIQAKYSSFSDITCIDGNCKKNLNQKSYIFGELDPQLRKKIQKYWAYRKIQQDKTLRPCMKQQCIGAIKIRKTQSKTNQPICCNQCKTEHCSKCFKLYHQGNCVVTEQQKNQYQMMTELNYRKCPKCSIWVEKKGGCDYLNCKCGVQFCFTCGIEFEHDPCRKKQIEPITKGIRKKLKNFHFRTPESVLGYIGILLKIVLGIPFLAVLLVIWSFLPLILILGLCLPLFILFSPGILIAMYGEMGLKGRNKIIARVLTVIFYPLIGVLIGIIAFGTLITYPIARFICPISLYDALDTGVSWLTLQYLRISVCILSL